MPLNRSSVGDGDDPLHLFTRRTANSRPSIQERGLSRSANVVVDEDAMEKWIKVKGYARDFVPRDRTPSDLGTSKSESRPTQTQRGLVQPRNPHLAVRRQQPQKAKTPHTRARNVHKPAIVKQKFDYDCWAAALESWLGAVGDPQRRQTRSQLMRQLPASDQGFDLESFRNFAAGFGMDTKVIDISEFNPESLKELLASSPALFVSYPVEEYSRWWHDVVLYEVKTDSLNEGTYSVMNPSGTYLTERHKDWRDAGLQIWKKRNFFPARTKLLIGWKARGRSGQLW